MTRLRRLELREYDPHWPAHRKSCAHEFFALIVARVPHSGVATGHQCRGPWWCPRTALIGMNVSFFAVVPKNVDKPNSLRKWFDIRREQKAAMLERIAIQRTPLLSHRTLIHLRESHHQFSRDGKIRLAICLQTDDGRS